MHRNRLSVDAQRVDSLPIRNILVSGIHQPVGSSELAHRTPISTTWPIGCVSGRLEAVPTMELGGGLCSEPGRILDVQQLERDE